MQLLARLVFRVLLLLAALDPRAALEHNLDYMHLLFNSPSIPPEFVGTSKFSFYSRELKAAFLSKPALASYVALVKK